MSCYAVPKPQYPGLAVCVDCCDDTGRQTCRWGLEQVLRHRVQYRNYSEVSFAIAGEAHIHGACIQFLGGLTWRYNDVAPAAHSGPYEDREVTGELVSGNASFCGQGHIIETICEIGSHAHAPLHLQVHNC